MPRVCSTEYGSRESVLFSVLLIAVVVGVVPASADGPIWRRDPWIASGVGRPSASTQAVEVQTSGIDAAIQSFSQARTASFDPGLEFLHGSPPLGSAVDGHGIVRLPNGDLFVLVAEDHTVVAMDSFGRHRWNLALAPGENIGSGELMLHPSGDLMVFGSSLTSYWFRAARITTAGGVLWAETIAGSPQSTVGAALDANGDLLVGGVDGDLMLVRVRGSDGSVVEQQTIAFSNWACVPAVTSPTFRGMDVDGTGAAYFGGFGNTSFGRNGFAIRIDPTGSAGWCAVDPDNYLGQEEWYDLAASPSGEVITAGAQDDGFAFDASGAYFDAAGQLLWQWSYGGGFWDRGWMADFDDLGHPVVGGSTENGDMRALAFVRRLDPAGNTIGYTRWAPNPRSNVSSLAVRGGSDVVAVGESLEYFYPDTWYWNYVGLWNAAGDRLFMRTTNTSDVVPRQVIVDASGSIYSAGRIDEPDQWYVQRHFPSGAQDWEAKGPMSRMRWGWGFCPAVTSWLRGPTDCSWSTIRAGRSCPCSIRESRMCSPWRCTRRAPSPSPEPG